MANAMTLNIASHKLRRQTGGVLRRCFDVGKRVADMTLGCIALILALPILAVCALIVKTSSRGAVLHTQIREGKDGELFTMYKLRTMYSSAESATGAVWASDNDPRVVPACRWMRRSHIDELPQLVNVLKGEMSLVGPRPERPEITARLTEVFPDFRTRLIVRPGITGLAQIRNGYDKTIESARRKLEADLEYIDSYGWSMDLKILLATLTKFYDKGAH